MTLYISPICDLFHCFNHFLFGCDSVYIGTEPLDAMYDYIRILQEHHYVAELASVDEHDRPPFQLRTADQLLKKDIGYPLFTYDKMVKVEGLVPSPKDQQLLTRSEQAWLLAEIPLASDHPTYAWAAFRPPRAVPWQIHAQSRSDGYFAPPGWTPKYPEPSKWYKRKPGFAFTQSPEHPNRRLRLRMLVRLSDALTHAALDHTQDWFFIDLPLFDDSPNTDSIGDLLLFVMELVGNQRLRSGQLVLSAGGPNERLWQRKMPLTVLWNHLHIASLKPKVQAVAYASLNNPDHLSELGNSTEEEGDYFAMAAVHSLPDWVVADEPKEMRERYASGPCRLPHEEMPEALLAEERMPLPCTAQSSCRSTQKALPRSSPAIGRSDKPTSSTSVVAAKPKKPAPDSGKRSKQGAFSYQ